MKTIWKYPLPTAGAPSLYMPAGAQILSLQVQGGVPCLWALVDPSRTQETRFFHIVGTGHELADNPGIYVGTFQVEGGEFVFHLFEVAS